MTMQESKRITVLKKIIIQYQVLRRRDGKVVCCLCETPINDTNQAEGHELRQLSLPDREYRFKHFGEICKSCLTGEVNRICNYAGI